MKNPEFVNFSEQFENSPYYDLVDRRDYEKNFEPITPYKILKENQKINAHTLFLLDLRPKENKFMTIKEALKYLLKIEEKKKEKLISEKTFCIGCARIGNKNQTIKYGIISQLIKADFGEPPYCLIIPSKLHFMEEEILKKYLITQ